MIYFDNASTTNKKPLCVKLEMLKSLTKKYCANPGRSGHNLSVNASIKVFDARENFNIKFGNDDVCHTIFTSGCTEALNLAILGSVKKGGHIIITSNEHNSVARPVAYLKQQGLIDYTIVEADKNKKINPTSIEKAIRENTYLIITNHCSNVTGVITDIEKIGKICKEHNIMYLVDGAQSSGHIKINMLKQNIDMLALAGHKGLLGPQGVGVLLYRQHINIKPIKFGGTGSHGEKLLPPIEPPESLEAGTSANPNIFALNAGLNYTYKHFDKINRKIENITKYILEELSKIKNVKLYTPLDSLNGVISFTIAGIENTQVATYLNDKGICIRSGMHCAPLVHQNLGTLSGGGTCRISVGNNNTIRQAKKLIKEINILVSQIGK